VAVLEVEDSQEEVAEDFQEGAATEEATAKRRVLLERNI